jgi:DNA helicase-2/ATP-dependent DNA helicase PcrA
MRAANPQQITAIESIHGPILVSAGAGSGKTFVLTERVRKLINEGYARPDQILIVTFTTKAANELKSRLGIQGLSWIGTFHSLCLRMLFDHQSTRPRVIDPLGQKSILKTINIPRFFQLHDVLEVIDAHKNTGAPISNPELRTIYREYEAIKKQNNTYDYADLLIEADRLLDRQDIAKAYHNQFQFLCIDEYQDTNSLQEGWLCKILGPHQNIFCVGDEDQSIFEWRGANPSLMRTFTDRFPNAKILKLEYNYRSTSTILSAANCLIKYNKQRFDKTLLATHSIGGHVEICECTDEADEAEFVVGRLREWGGSSAILCRTVTGLRAFEDALQKLGVGVDGRTSFYQRAEVRDVLAFAEFLESQDLDAFRRIVNLPKRGIGEKRIEMLCRSVLDGSNLIDTSRAEPKLQEFVLAYEVAKVQPTPAQQLRHFLESTGYLTLRRSDPSREAKIRSENVETIIADVARTGTFPARNPTNEIIEPQIRLMTLHTAKGLEFDNVALPGWIEGILPHATAIGENKVPEERRLAYVGVTRARSNLLITYPQYLQNKRQSSPSRFLTELPLVVPWNRQDRVNAGSSIGRK